MSDETTCPHQVVTYAPSADRKLMEARCLDCGKTAETTFLGETDVDRATETVLATIRGTLVVN